MLAEDFRKCLDGRSVKWFFDEKIKGKVKIGYSGFTAQLNGYTSDLSPEIKEILIKFMEESNGKKVH